MKVLRSAVGVCCLVVILFSFGTNIVSCKKDTVTVHDTIYDLKDGMVAYYTFNNGSLNDSSGRNNNITFNNAAKTADRFGRANNAYLFNGTNSYMKVANSASLNQLGGITLMAIVKLNDFYKGDCHGNSILMKGFQDQRPGVYTLRVTDNASSCAIAADTTKERTVGFFGDYGNTSSATDTTSYVHTGAWMTIVYTFDGLQSKLYINGKLKVTYSQPAIFNGNSSDLFIGRAETDQYPFWFNGAIDEIRIYNRSLGEPAVKQLSASTN